MYKTHVPLIELCIKYIEFVLCYVGRSPSQLDTWELQLLLLLALQVFSCWHCKCSAAGNGSVQLLCGCVLIARVDGVITMYASSSTGDVYGFSSRPKPSDLCSLLPSAGVSSMTFGIGFSSLLPTAPVLVGPDLRAARGGIVA